MVLNFLIFKYIKNHQNYILDNENKPQIKILERSKNN